VGRPSIDPEPMIRLQIVGWPLDFLENSADVKATAPLGDPNGRYDRLNPSRKPTYLES
jgi:hypothetical protein